MSEIDWIIKLLKLGWGEDDYDSPQLNEEVLQ